MLDQECRYIVIGLRGEGKGLDNGLGAGAKYASKFKALFHFSFLLYAQSSFFYIVALLQKMGKYWRNKIIIDREEKN